MLAQTSMLLCVEPRGGRMMGVLIQFAVKFVLAIVGVLIFFVILALTANWILSPTGPFG